MTFAIRAEPAPITFDEHGVARVGGTRVTLESVLWTYQMGASAEEIAEQFPALELADVYAVITHYLRHRDVVHPLMQGVGWEANQLVSLDDTWSALHFRPPDAKK